MGGTTKVRWVHRANGRLAGIIFEQSRDLCGLAILEPIADLWKAGMQNWQINKESLMSELRPACQCDHANQPTGS